MWAAIYGCEEKSELALTQLAYNIFRGVIVHRIRASQNYNAKGVTDIEANATIAHSLSIYVVKVKTVEGKVRVARKRVDLGFANRDSIETRLNNLGFEQCKVRRELAAYINVAGDEGFSSCGARCAVIQ